MSETFYRCEVRLPSSLTGSMSVGIEHGTVVIVDGTPWVQRPYGYMTKGTDGWHETPVAAWEAAAVTIREHVSKLDELLLQCRRLADAALRGEVVA